MEEMQGAGGCAFACLSCCGIGAAVALWDDVDDLRLLEPGVFVEMLTRCYEGRVGLLQKSSGTLQ